MIWYLIHKETSKEEHKDNIDLTDEFYVILQ